MTDTSASMTEQAWWEAFYQDRDQIWTGNPNPLLVREAEELTPGTALDLGCGEGGDAIWLAAQGWQVTAVDISATALRRAAKHADEAGVGGRIVWAEHDLGQSFPEGSFDLVSAQFFHSPVAHPEYRELVLRRAAEAVAPGGVLVIGSHAGWPSFVDDSHSHVHFPTIEETLDRLEIEPDDWQVDTADAVEREMTDHEGQVGVRTDIVIRLRRTR